MTWDAFFIFLCSHPGTIPSPPDCGLLTGSEHATFSVRTRCVVVPSMLQPLSSCTHHPPLLAHRYDLQQRLKCFLAPSQMVPIGMLYNVMYLPWNMVTTACPAASSTCGPRESLTRGMRPAPTSAAHPTLTTLLYQK